MSYFLVRMSAFLAALAFLDHTPVQAEEADSPPDPVKRWRFFLQENEINRLLVDLASEHRPGRFRFDDVTVLTMTSDAPLPGYSVYVENGVIRAVGPNATVQAPDDAVRVSAAGKFLMPGLVDMHVHTLVTNSHHLLNLAHGVTSVREMCGFPWLLKLRDAVRENKLLAPNLYVAGRIMNGAPLDMYAEVVTDPDGARKLVRQQQAAGYEFIKVHNVMKPPVYEAICDEARKCGIDVVGHIPHSISLQKAIAQGQRTLEHFKGYYLDRTLEMTQEDYVGLTRGAEVWNCPTLYTYRIGLRGDRVRALLEGDEGRYISPDERARWLKAAEDDGANAHTRVFEMSQKIFHDLVAIGAKFLAGTDSGGGYPMMVPGFALQEELRLMSANGLSARGTLRAATVNAAEAMRRTREFGAVEPGKRADLVLLSKNPLDGVEAVGAVEGVMVRGIWLDRAALDRILARIREIYSENSPTMIKSVPSRDQIERLAQSVVELHGRGFIHMSHDLRELIGLMKAAGVAPDAIEGILKAVDS